MIQHFYKFYTMPGWWDQNSILFSDFYIEH